MMESLTEYGILYLLPENVGRYHRELRLKIERQFNLGGPTEFTVPSHIAMKYRFPVDHLADLETAIETFCRSQVKTKWSLQGYNYFDNSDSFVIFIDVIPSQETREAHARLLCCLRQIPWVQWGPFDHANLHYHVTLASKGITAENFSAVWSYVNQQAFPRYELFFDNLALIRIVEETHTVYKKYWLLDQVGL